MKSFIVLTMIFIWASAEAAPSYTLPLNFNLKHATYSLDVRFGQDSPQTLPLMIDTGSSNLVVVGDESFCKECSYLNHYPPIKLTPELKSLKERFKIKYGLGQGTLQSYQTTVTLNDTLTLPNFKFAIFKEGQKLNNTLGLAYRTIALPPEDPQPTFFERLNQAYGLNDEFSLLLCDNRHDSFITFGPNEIKDDTPLATLAIEQKKFYQVPLLQIGAGKKHALTSINKKNITIVDSGTSGKIVLPKDHFKALISYLKEHTSKKNQALSKTFWKGRSCVKKKRVDEKRFPTLYFTFKDLKGKSVQLPLPPERYITENSCGKGYLRLAFISEPQTDFIILGTPFLEQYRTRFQQRNPARVSFYQSNKCNRE